MIVISASQLRTFVSCPRKWMHEKVLRLPIRQSKSQVFGTVLHAVNERFLKADDLGYDPETGQPVDLYPEGWEYSYGFDNKPLGCVTLEEQATIKTLVQKAIEEGVLERQKGRQIEHEFRMPVIDGVELVGFIDVLNPHRIEDHKTTSSMRYAESKNSLGNNLQMLVYGYYALSRLEEKPETIWFRHNIFCKAPNDLRVRKVEVEVPTEKIFEHWNDVVVPAAEEMKRLKEEKPDPFLLPDPSVDTCNQYGGCPFMRICSKEETHDQYAKRVDEAAKFAYSLTIGGKAVAEQQGSGDPDMSSFREKMAARRRAISTEAVEAEPVPPVEQSPAANDPVPPLRQTEGAPPWANPGCGACKGFGFSTTGAACRICDIHAKKAGRPMSSEFAIALDDEGNLVWSDKETGEVVGSVPSRTAKTPVKADAREKPVERMVRNAVDAALQNAPDSPPDAESVETGDEAPAAPVEPRRAVLPGRRVVAPPPPPAEPEEAEEAGDDEDEEQAQPQPKATTRGKPGRPKKGFILCVNCIPIRGIARAGSGRGVIYGFDLLETIYKQICVEKGIDSPYEMDPFARREKIHRIAVSMAETFKTDIVSITGVSGSNCDMKALLDALRPLCGMEITGSFS